jgi:hypothetical protein
MYNFNTVNVVIGLIVLLVLGLVGVPFLLIWSLNTLFSLGIAYSLVNWAAMLGLFVGFNALFSAKVKIKS